MVVIKCCVDSSCHFPISAAFLHRIKRVSVELKSVNHRHMANLSYAEKRNLEEFLGMLSGYVCNFSDRTFREFVFDSTGLDINDVAIGGQGSKARRLRHFWTDQPDYIVGKLLNDRTYPEIQHLDSRCVQRCEEQQEPCPR